VESSEIFLPPARKEKYRPANAAHDTCRCVARTVNAAGCCTVPLTTRKIPLVLLVCGPSQGNPARSPIQFRYSWSRSRFCNGSSSCPWNSSRRACQWYVCLKEHRHSLQQTLLFCPEQSHSGVRLDTQKCYIIWCFCMTQHFLQRLGIYISHELLYINRHF